MDVYNLLPINGTAAIVTGQKGCTDKLTYEQERRSIIDHVNQLDDKIAVLKKSDPKRKTLGLEKHKLQGRLKNLKEKMKTFGAGKANRNDLCDCVFDVMREQLTPFKYKQIMRLARELFAEDTNEKL